MDSGTRTTQKKKKKSLLEVIRPKLRRFQIEALEFATTGKPCRHGNSEEPVGGAVNGNGRILLADEMGLGKTVTALAIASHYEETDWPVMIMCPASLRYTWPSEIEKFWPNLPPSEVHIATGFSDIAWMDKVRSGKVRIVVVTYSLLQQRSTVAQSLLDQIEEHKKLQKKKENKTSGPLPVYFPTIICDESHNLKQKDSQRMKMAQPLLLASRRLLLLSGTPALARPVELWTQLNALSPKLFGSFKTYAERYCDPRRTFIFSNGGRRFPKLDYSGSSHMDELHAKLKGVMVRRLKTDVLDELPPKSRNMVYLDVTTDQVTACRKAMKEVKGSHEASKIFNSDSSFESKQALMQAYQATGIGKASAVAGYLLDWLEGSASTEKIVVFAHHKKVLDSIHDALCRKCSRETSKKGGKTASTHIRIDGQVDSSVRHRLVRQFQTQPHTRVALLSVTAAGVGLTLTAASTVLFAELHWTPGVLAQAEDRVHRIGASASKVSQMLYCICKDKEMSLDPLLCKILGKKMHTLSRVVDGSSEFGRNTAFLAGAENASAPHQSGQDELTNFFATNIAPAATGRTTTSPRPRGSIEFFLAKAKAKSARSDSTARSPSTAKAGTLPFDDGEKAPCDLVKWTCSACTFANSKAQCSSELYCCEMCNETHSRWDLQPQTTFVTPTPKSKAHSKQEVIELDMSDDDAEECYVESEVVEIIDSPPAKKQKQMHQDPIRGSKEHVWEFSVSNNSGRVTLHRNGMVTFNFDLEDVLAPDTMDDLLSRQSRNTDRPVTIAFSPNGLKNLAARVKRDHTVLDREAKQLVLETKTFINNYLRLREIEKKAIKESCRSFPCGGLAHSAAKILSAVSQSNCQQGTERYSGGAKERALKKRDDGDPLNEQDVSVLDGTGCAWCGEQLSRAHKRAKSVYCNQSCAEEGRLRRGGRFASKNIRTAIFALEGGQCSLCNVDAQQIYEQVLALQPSERLNKLLGAKWKLPRSACAVQKLLNNPKEGDFWQVDHIKAVSTGGGNCGLENLRTLCVPCHQRETEKLRSTLKLQGGPWEKGKPRSEEARKRKQADIRSSFFSARK